MGFHLQFRVAAFLILLCFMSCSPKVQSSKSPVTTDVAKTDESLYEHIETDLNDKELDAFFADAKIGTADIVKLEALRPRRLSFMDCEIEKDAVQRLTQLASLERLALHGCTVDDNSLIGIDRLTNLVELDLAATQVGDETLKRIATLKNLTSLNVIHTTITSRGVQYLSGMPLKELGLVQNPIGDDGLLALRDMNTLQELQVEETGITNDGLRHLGGLIELRVLTVHNNDGVDESGLAHLERLTKLETFYFCNPVTESGVKSLRQLKSLKNFYIGGAMRDTRRGRDWLSTQLPGVGIY